MSVETETLAISIPAIHPQKSLAEENGQHHVENFGASTSTLS